MQQVDVRYCRRATENTVLERSNTVLERSNTVQETSNDSVKKGYKQAK